MTAKLIKTFAAAIVVSAIAITSFAQPATAGGQLAINYAPTNSDEAQVLGLGLQLYSLFKTSKSGGAYINQSGQNNTAGGQQAGSNNTGVVVQRGNGHQGTVSQNGNGNSCGLFQFGRNTNASCGQSGNGNSSLTTVFGF